MAKVQVKDDCIDIRVSMVERLVLSERSRRVPLSRVRSVDPHPAVVDMVLHWADQSGVWLSGASTYEGHLVPSSRNPGKTMAIDLADDGRIFVEVDDEPCEAVASRISHAMNREATNDNGAVAAHGSAYEPNPSEPPAADSPGDSFIRTKTGQTVALAELLRRDHELFDDDEVESAEPFFADPEDDENVRRRDPLLQGSLPPAALRADVGVDGSLDVPWDASRLGSAGLWLLGIGTLCVITGTASVSGGIPLGLVALGAGLAMCVIGGLAIRLSASHAG